MLSRQIHHDSRFMTRRLTGTDPMSIGNIGNSRCLRIQREWLLLHETLISCISFENITALSPSFSYWERKKARGHAVHPFFISNDIHLCKTHGQLQFTMAGEPKASNSAISNGSLHNQMTVLRQLTLTRVSSSNNKTIYFFK